MPAQPEESEELKTSAEDASDKEDTAAAGGPRRKGIIHARTIVRLVLFLLVIVGLFVGIGWGSFSSFGWDAIAYICPLGVLETFVASHTIIPRAALAGLCILIVFVLLGRVFCSWACPVPPLQHFFHPGGNKKDKDAQIQADVKRELQGVGDCSACGETEGACSHSCGLKPVGGKRDGFHFDSRYGVLIGALASSAIFGFPVFCLVCPVGLSIAFVVSLYAAFFEQSPTLSLLIFAAILFVEVFFLRKWCHKICPMGALMSLVGAKAPFGKPHVDTTKCLRSDGTDCHVCVETCPELLDPHSKSIPECTRCGLCAEACPTEAIKMRKIRVPAKTPCEQSD